MKSQCLPILMRDDSPLTIWRYDIARPELTVNLLKSNVNGVVVQVMLRHLAADSGGQTGYLDTITSITPSRLALPRAVYPIDISDQRSAE